MARFEDSQSVSSDSVVVYVEQSHFRARKSKMAAKIQDGGRKFLFLWTKKLRMVLGNNHTKNGACCQSVTAQGFFHPLIQPLLIDNTEKGQKWDKNVNEKGKNWAIISKDKVQNCTKNV